MSSPYFASSYWLFPRTQLLIFDSGPALPTLPKMNPKPFAGDSVVHPHPYFSLVMPLPLDRDLLDHQARGLSCPVLGLLAAPPPAMLPAMYHVPLLTRLPCPVPSALATCEPPVSRHSCPGWVMIGKVVILPPSLPQGPHHKLPSICCGPGWEIKHWVQ